MERFSFSHLQRDQPAPSFRLKSSRDGLIALSDYREQSNLVIVFLHSLDCPRYQRALQNFVDYQREYQENSAQVLVVVSGPAAQSALEEAEAYPFPVLADPESTARRAYAVLLSVPVEDEPMIFILDRYGAPYAALICSDLSDPSLQKEILKWLDFIEIQCPE